ncbi:hypothetical protein HDU98_001676 [Podochytrium sp. JEL0797]|nr:hypothetical protein HDU98_001676 [Podochytrium sp. JEL0797]
MTFDDVFAFTQPTVKTRVICVALDESKVLLVSPHPPRRAGPRARAGARPPPTPAPPPPTSSTPIIDEVVLLHCRTPPPPLAMPSPTNLITTNTEYVSWMTDQARTQSHTLIQKYADNLMNGAKGGLVVRGLSLVGDPRIEVCEMAKRLGAEVVIVGTRGMGLIQKAVMGSVSDHLLHNLECSVIVVRGSKE